MKPEHLLLFAAAVRSFGEAARGVSQAFRVFAMYARWGTGRFMMRQWQRANRRPPLIHNGGKPRRRKR